MGMSRGCRLWGSAVAGPKFNPDVRTKMGARGSDVDDGVPAPILATKPILEVPPRSVSQPTSEPETTDVEILALSAHVLAIRETCRHPQEYTLNRCSAGIFLFGMRSQVSMDLPPRSSSTSPMSPSPHCFGRPWHAPKSLGKSSQAQRDDGRPSSSSPRGRGPGGGFGANPGREPAVSSVPMKLPLCAPRGVQRGVASHPRAVRPQRELQVNVVPRLQGEDASRSSAAATSPP